MAEPTTVVLIGPVCTGKTTLLPLVAERLGRPHVDLDAVAETYYQEVDRGRTAFLEKIADTSRGAAHEWWQEGHPHAVRRVLAEHSGSVIAFGAGHTSFRNPQLAEEVRHALVATNAFVVLVLPCADGDRAVDVLRARSQATRGRDWIEDGTDFIARWVHDPHHAALATITVHTEGRSPEETADDIAAAVQAESPPP